MTDPPTPDTAALRQAAQAARDAAWAADLDEVACHLLTMAEAMCGTKERLDMAILLHGEGFRLLQIAKDLRALVAARGES